KVQYAAPALPDSSEEAVRRRLAFFVRVSLSPISNHKLQSDTLTQKRRGWSFLTKPLLSETVSTEINST
ncbi:MAG: hypothetical protein J6M23_08150, partial [Bacteroidales bacterium]|nr:hypothetical protein [Bacteroidales bacterium]